MKPGLHKQQGERTTVPVSTDARLQPALGGLLYVDCVYWPGNFRGLPGVRAKLCVWKKLTKLAAFNLGGACIPEYLCKRAIGAGYPSILDHGQRFRPGLDQGGQQERVSVLLISGRRLQNGIHVYSQKFR